MPTMRWPFALFAILVLVLSTASAAEDAAMTPEKIDQNLERFADALGIDGMGGYRWPDQFTSIGFKTSSTEGAMVSEAALACSDAGGPTVNPCLLITGQIYGVALHQGAAITKAEVVMTTPDGSARILLPLKECTAMGKAILAQPEDEEAVKDAIFEFTVAMSHVLK